MTEITRVQRERLAALLIDRAGMIVEFWDEVSADDPALAGITSEQAAQQLATWLKRLPGTAWSTALPEV